MKLFTGKISKTDSIGTSINDGRNDLTVTDETNSSKLEDNGYPEYLLNHAPIIGFESDEAKQLAYEFITHGLELSNNTLIVNYNCKRGDYYQYVKNINHNIDYIGFDTNDLLLEVGKFKYLNNNFDNILKFSLYNTNYNEVDYSIINNKANDGNIIFINILPDSDGIDKFIKLINGFKENIDNNNININKFEIIILLEESIKVTKLNNILDENNIYKYGIDHTLGNDIYKILITV